MSFTITQLKTFVMIVQCGSFTAAAKRMGKAQSVVSDAISNLEIDLDLILFDRIEKRPQLTEAGKALLYSVNTVLLHCQNLEERARALHLDTETALRLVVDDAVPFDVLRVVLQQFVDRFPQVELIFLSPQGLSVVDIVLDKQAHLGLTLSSSYSGQNISFCRLGDVQLANVVCADHPLAQINGGISFAELHRYRQLVYMPLTGAICQRINISLPHLSVVPTAISN